MYSITQSPTFAIDLAHAVMDEHLRRASAHRLPQRRSGAGDRERSRSWPRFTRHPAPAF